MSSNKVTHIYYLNNEYSRYKFINIIENNQ